ncbi:MULTISPECIES: acetyl-CoA carboxylase biotin carboxyl carrier protein subunit [unclassified Robiginitalea]|uniref:acetyl-CoA carboxylase biotin carboxyl carrier protein subunit n=1 Tax=Robiginitalea TaxID=252306 RepID=UPI00234B534D|nr:MULTISPECIES: acetyl-CoA carboxylase biotin carboxyl carrier protein subunit [unclassified Robiginitalea]MDC6354834.1 acetyl-CoA carboxylase biotin carboxyl carrier protein subunit [Robiginitalea sp. PM2]MDC6375100.1 acetyl-CoA carboxylase biotin carboxyl carrier protein subunit [Robiginitalea sp. SP8]
MTNAFRATVDGSRSFELDAEEARRLDLVPAGSGEWHLLEDHHSSRIRILESRPGEKYYRIGVNNRIFDVRLADDLDLQIDRMGFELQSAQRVSRIEAPMPGLILSVQVSEGDRVSEGDPLLVLEAMKMENAILAPADGVIGHVAVREGDAVEKKAVLVEFE